MKSIYICCLVLVSSIVFGQKEDTLDYQGGTYSFGKNVEKGAVGSISIYPISSTKALFYLDVCRGAPSYNMGQLFGVMNIEGPNGTYENRLNEWMDCSLQFVFSKKHVVIDYIEDGYNCGFGHAVYANNTYKLIRKDIPQYYITGSGDTIPFIAAFANMVEVDVYPVPEIEVLHEFSMQSGNTFANNQLWLKNDSLNQVLVSAEYGDYGEFIDVHFYKNKVPKDLIHRMEFTTEDGELVENAQKEMDFDGIASQATPMTASVFESANGLRLGDRKEESIRLYGEPHQTEVTEGIERLEWKFSGEHDFDPKELKKGERIARDSFGFEVIQYYENGKLIAQMLLRAMP